MPHYKPQRQARYQYLRGKHFAPVEARDLSKLKRNYPALQRMIRQRASLWSGFERRAKRHGWESQNKRTSEWRNTLTRFYTEERYKTRRDRKTGKVERILTNWVVHKDVHGNPINPRPSAWEWYDAVFAQLPDEDKWDSPRSHRHKTKEPNLRVDKVMLQKWIAGLDKSIKSARTKEEKDRFREQKRRLLKESH